MISESSGAEGTFVSSNSHVDVHVLLQPCFSRKCLATLSTDMRLDILVNDVNMLLKLVFLVVRLPALLTHKIFADVHFKMNLIDMILHLNLGPGCVGTVFIRARLLWSFIPSLLRSGFSLDRASVLMLKQISCSGECLAALVTHKVATLSMRCFTLDLVILEPAQKQV